MKRKVSKHKRILLLLIFALIFHCYPSYAYRKSIQQKIISIAQNEIGKGETFADNQGETITKYFANSGISGAWCGAFVSWVLHQAGITELGFCASARQMYNKAEELGWIVKEPRSGDLIVFWRNKENSWQGHIEIVERVHLDEIITIAGNVGSFPAKVKRVHHRIDLSRGIPRLLGYIRTPERR